MSIVKSILLLDDEQDSLDLTSSLLKVELKAYIATTKLPSHAIRLAAENCFDLVLLDVTLSFNGSQFGGLEVYKALHSRYGRSSIAVYSQYITDDLLQRYDLAFNFIEKGHGISNWIPALCTMLTKLRGEQTCFVAMPFGSSYDPVFEIVRNCVHSAGYVCVRIDQAIFTDSIEQRIFSEIKNAKLIIFIATGGNANVFYEAGYAVALNKEIITITDSFQNLPFDIRNRKAIAYSDDPNNISFPLTELLRSLTSVRLSS